MNTLAIGAALPRVAVDRWVYVFTAVLFIAVALAGFIPDSITKVAEIEAGRREPFPVILHLHAVVMGAWLVLLLTQTSLIATGRRSLHQTLGLSTLVLGAAVVAVMIGASLDAWTGLTASSPPEVLARRSNVLLAQGRAILYFALFFIWAIAVRKTDSETHKRMMFLATVVVLPAAVTRILWLPTTMPASYDGVHAYMLLCLAPLVTRDIIRLGRPHRAYLIGLALLAPWMIAMHYLWGAPWWLQTAPKLMGL